MMIEVSSGNILVLTTSSFKHVNVSFRATLVDWVFVIANSITMIIPLSSKGYLLINYLFHIVGRPLAPSLSVSSVSATSAILEWTQNLDQPVTRYFLRWTYTGPCSPQPPQSMLISGSARSFTVTGLEEGGSYTFGLTAINGEGSSPESNATGQALPTGTNSFFVRITVDLEIFVLHETFVRQIFVLKIFHRNDPILH